MSRNADLKAQRFMPLVHRMGATAKAHGIQALVVLGPEYPKDWGQIAIMNVTPPSNDVRPA